MQRSAALPVVACLLALSWMLAMVLDSGLMAWISVLGATAGAVALAPPRRRALLHRVAVAAVFGVLGAGLLVLVVRPPAAPAGFLLQLTLMAVLAPLVPAVYALTFDTGEGQDPPP
jgi:hypothetical protein